MRLTNLAAAAALCVALLSPVPTSARSGPAADPTKASPATFAGDNVQFDFPSTIIGRTFRIFVYRPRTAAPAGGYPALFETDGNFLFPTAAVQMWGGGAGFDMRPAMIVAIGYPTDDFNTIMNKPRFRDLTPPAPADQIDKTYLGGDKTIADFGGSDLLYRFLTEELRPWLAARYPMNMKDQALCGHSLGGLFVIDTMFKHPDAFAVYLASSPSIWWANRHVLQGEAAFHRAVETGQVAPRILIMAGGLEQTPVASVPGLPKVFLDQYNKSLNEARMVDNARELADRLKALKGAAGYEVTFHAFDAEDHVSVAPAALSRALQFAFGFRRE